MIFIHPNHAFYSSLHPSTADSSNIQTNSAECPQTAGSCFLVGSPRCDGKKKRSCGKGAASPLFDLEKALSCGKGGAPTRFDVEKTPLHRDETSEKTVLSLDVAGFQAEQLSIEINNHILTISGERTNKLGDTFVTTRRFTLQHDVYDEDNVSANLEDGVLAVTIVKKLPRQSRKVTISVVPSATSTTLASAASDKQKDEVKAANSNDIMSSARADDEATNQEALNVEAAKEGKDPHADGTGNASAQSPSTKSNKSGVDGSWEHVADA